MAQRLVIALIVSASVFQGGTKANDEDVLLARLVLKSNNLDFPTLTANPGLESRFKAAMKEAFESVFDPKGKEDFAEVLPFHVVVRLQGGGSVIIFIDIMGSPDPATTEAFGAGLCADRDLIAQRALAFALNIPGIQDASTGNLDMVPVDVMSATGQAICDPWTVFSGGNLPSTSRGPQLVPGNSATVLMGGNVQAPTGGNAQGNTQGPTSGNAQGPTGGKPQSMPADVPEALQHQLGSAVEGMTGLLGRFEEPRISVHPSTSAPWSQMTIALLVSALMLMAFFLVTVRRSHSVGSADAEILLDDVVDAVGNAD